MLPDVRMEFSLAWVCPDFTNGIQFREASENGFWASTPQLQHARRSGPKNGFSLHPVTTSEQDNDYSGLEMCCLLSH